MPHDNNDLLYVVELNPVVKPTLVAPIAMPEAVVIKGKLEKKNFASLSGEISSGKISEALTEFRKYDFSDLSNIEDSLKIFKCSSLIQYVRKYNANKTDAIIESIVKFGCKATLEDLAFELNRGLRSDRILNAIVSSLSKQQILIPDEYITLVADLKGSKSGKRITGYDKGYLPAVLLDFINHNRKINGEPLLLDLSVGNDNNNESALASESIISVNSSFNSSKRVKITENFSEDIEDIPNPGNVISVYWEGDKKYFTGYVMEVNEQKTSINIRYDDGDWQWENFADLRYKMISFKPAEDKSFANIEDSHVYSISKDSGEVTKLYCTRAELLKHSMESSRELADTPTRFVKRKSSKDKFKGAISSEFLPVYNRNIIRTGEDIPTPTSTTTTTTTTTNQNRNSSPDVVSKPLSKISKLINVEEDLLTVQRKKADIHELLAELDEKKLALESERQKLDDEEKFTQQAIEKIREQEKERKKKDTIKNADLVRKYLQDAANEISSACAVIDSSIGLLQKMSNDTDADNHDLTKELLTDVQNSINRDTFHFAYTLMPSKIAELQAELSKIITEDNEIVNFNSRLSLTINMS